MRRSVVIRRCQQVGALAAYSADENYTHGIAARSFRSGIYLRVELEYIGFRTRKRSARPRRFGLLAFGCRHSIRLIRFNLVFHDGIDLEMFFKTRFRAPNRFVGRVYFARACAAVYRSAIAQAEGRYFRVLCQRQSGIAVFEKYRSLVGNCFGSFSRRFKRAVFASRLFVLLIVMFQIPIFCVFRIVHNAVSATDVCIQRSLEKICHASYRDGDYQHYRHNRYHNGKEPLVAHFELAFFHLFYSLYFVSRDTSPDQSEYITPPFGIQ